MKLADPIQVKWNNTLGAAAEAQQLILPPEGVLRRVELLIFPAVVGNPATAQCEAIYFFKRSGRGDPASVIVRGVPLTEATMLSWDGELYIGQDWALQFNLTNGTVGDLYVGTALVEVP